MCKTLEIYSYFWSNFFNSHNEIIIVSSLIVLLLSCSSGDSPAASEGITDLDGKTYTPVTIGKQTL
jgi:hypothetical protein